MHRVAAIAFFALTFAIAMAPIAPAAFTGEALLTVTGAIDKTNRDAFDAFHDGFFNHHEKSFMNAYEFDSEALAALPQKTITANADVPQWPATLKMEGPLLKDVLAAAGAKDKDITLYALDGYGAEMNSKDIAARDWVLAMKVNGKALGVGGRGPLWLAYDTGDRKVDEQGEAAWVWSVFHIEVK